MNALHFMRTLHHPIKSAGMALVMLTTLAGLASEAAAQLKLPNAGAQKPAAVPDRAAIAATTAGQAATGGCDRRGGQQ